ncbi:MAG: exopolyphosphatase [Betaproteobacteria bacterium]|nr:exopolyphosphatase [Betaproteobacteria bacterium]
MPSGVRLAAVDLGSNSYRLEIARVEQGHLQRAEYLKETVRQGGGLDANRNLTREAMQRGWDCLARFAERLSGFDRAHVRAVATQTLREARNRDEFLARASEVLGFPIDVISGHEEARLIYSGVAHLLPQSNERRLVIDIGGRSTELILGSGHDARVMASYRVGSVAWSMRHFADGLWTPKALKAAEIAAQAILDEALSLYPREAWDTAYGASGTVGAVADVLAQSGFKPGIITREGVDWLTERMLAAGSAERLRADGLKDDRKPVIAGGLSVLRAVFDLLQIDTLHAADGALRHGVLYDLLDRGEDHDIRSSTVERLAQGFGVDLQQAARVREVALQLFTQMRGRRDDANQIRAQRKLSWAATLHEIGARISHADYHKHGAYILDHVDASGFAVQEMHRLSLLVLGHRGKLRKLEADFDDRLLMQQLMALRLAVLLCHARRDPHLQGVSLALDEQHRLFRLQLPPDWAQRYPQSAHLLREECVAWQKTTWALEVAA